MTYTAYAQIVETEEIHGRVRQPTADELLLINDYREAYRIAFAEYPVGTHWIDNMQKMVLLRRAGGAGQATRE